MEEPKGPILHVLVVGFHHKKGCQVEYSFPALVPGSPNECPVGWKYLPTLALPDGSHNYGEDTVFFHLPSLTNPKKTIYGISCFRQIPVEKVKNLTDDITRGTVQKSVCVLSSLPLYGHIEVKMSLITHAYFDEGDFSKVNLLEDTFHHLNACLMQNNTPLQNFVGLSAREFILQWRHKAVLLYKLMLLERKIIFFKSPVQPLCTTILTLLSLHPGMIEQGLEQSACIKLSRPMSPMPDFADEAYDPPNTTLSDLKNVPKSSTDNNKSDLINGSHFISSSNNNIPKNALNTTSVTIENNLESPLAQNISLSQQKNASVVAETVDCRETNDSVVAETVDCCKTIDSVVAETVDCCKTKDFQVLESIENNLESSLVQNNILSTEISIDSQQTNDSIIAETVDCCKTKEIPLETAKNKLKSPLVQNSSLSAVKTIDSIAAETVEGCKTKDLQLLERIKNYSESIDSQKTNDSLVAETIDCKTKNIQLFETVENNSQTIDIQQTNDSLLAETIDCETENVQLFETVENNSQTIDSQQTTDSLVAETKNVQLFETFDNESQQTIDSLVAETANDSKTIESLESIEIGEREEKPSLPRDSSLDTFPINNTLSTLTHISTANCDIPLTLFSQGYLCLPYLSLPYIDLLTDLHVRGYIVGATNVLFKQKRNLCDVLIEIDGTKIESQDQELRKQLHLTTEDLRFADFLVKHVQEEKHDVFLDGVGWEGGCEWIRAQFRVYLLCLLRTSLLQEGSREIEHFNSSFMSAWKDTHNYKMWISGEHPGILEINPGHPFAGQLSVADMKLRFAHTMQNTESGRKINQAMVSTGRAVATTGRAVGGAISQAKGALTNWWSNLLVSPDNRPSIVDGEDEEIIENQKNAQNIPEETIEVENCIKNGFPEENPN